MSPVSSAGWKQILQAQKCNRMGLSDPRCAEGDETVLHSAIACGVLLNSEWMARVDGPYSEDIFVNWRDEKEREVSTDRFLTAGTTKKCGIS